MDVLPDLGKLSNDELDRRIDELAAREQRLSRERSLVQGQLDICLGEREERVHGRSLTPVSADRLARYLKRRPLRSAPPMEIGV